MPLDRERAKEHMKYSTARKLEDVIAQQIEKGEPLDDIKTESGLLKGPAFGYCAKPVILGELGTAIPAFIQFTAIMASVLGMMIVMFIAAMALDYRNQGDEARETWSDLFSPYLSWAWTAGNAPPKSITSPLVPILVLALTVFVIVLMPRFKVMQRRLMKQCDIDAVHPNDFTIMVKGLPRDALSEEELSEFFSIRHDDEGFKHGDKHGPPIDPVTEHRRRTLEKNASSETSSDASFSSEAETAVPNPKTREVVKVVVGFDIVKFCDVADRIAYIEKRLHRINNPEESICGACCSCNCPHEAAEDADCCGCCLPRTHTFGGLLQEKRYLKELAELKEKQASFQNLKEADLECSGFAFVTFRYQQDLRQVVNYWYHSFWPTQSRHTFGLIGARTPLFRGVHPITVCRAPNPSDILWRNLGLPLRTVALLRAASIAGFFLILAGSAVGVWALIKWNISYRSEDSGDENFWNWLFSLVLSFVPGWCVSLVNVAMWSVVDVAVDRERHPTTTSRDVSALRKTSIFLVLNTAMVYLIVQRSSEYWYSRGGLVENVFVAFLFAALYDPIYYLIDPFGRIPRWIAMCFVSTKRSKMSQEKYENMWVGPAFSTYGRFAVVIKLVIVAGIYLPIFPLGASLALIALLLNFLTDRWLLLRHCRKPPIQGDDIGVQALNTFHWLFTLVPGLSMYFLPPHFKSRGLLFILGGIASGLNAVMAFMVPQAVHEKFLCAGSFIDFIKVIKEDFTAAPDYYEAQQCFAQTYHTSNPVYAGLSEDANPRILYEGVTSHKKFGKGQTTLNFEMVDLGANLGANLPTDDAAAAADAAGARRKGREATTASQVDERKAARKAAKKATRRAEKEAARQAAEMPDASDMV